MRVTQRGLTLNGDNTVSPGRDYACGRCGKSSLVTSERILAGIPLRGVERGHFKKNGSQIPLFLVINHHCLDLTRGFRLASRQTKSK